MTEALLDCSFLHEEIHKAQVDPGCSPCGKWFRKACGGRGDAGSLEVKLGNSRNAIVIGLSGRCKKKGKSEGKS
jgi:hypothetical protein